MERLTKKVIKECKRNVSQYGADYYGWHKGLIDVIASIDVYMMLEITEELFKLGYSQDKDFRAFECALITEFTKQVTYQGFKKMLPCFLGKYGVRYENGECIQY